MEKILRCAMRLLLVFVSLLSLQTLATPILVHLDTSDPKGMMLLNPEAHRFIPVPDTGLEFIALRTDEWQLRFGDKTMTLNTLLSMCTKQRERRADTLSVCEVSLTQDGAGLHQMKVKVTETLIPKVVFLGVLGLFYRNAPSLFYALPSALRQVRETEDWLRLDLPVLVPVFEETLKTVKSPLIQGLCDHLSKQLRGPKKSSLTPNVLLLLPGATNVGRYFH